MQFFFQGGRERERGDPEHGVNVVMDKGLENMVQVVSKAGRNIAKIREDI